MTSKVSSKLRFYSSRCNLHIIKLSNNKMTSQPQPVTFITSNLNTNQVLALQISSIRSLGEFHENLSSGEDPS